MDNSAQFGAITDAAVHTSLWFPGAHTLDMARPRPSSLHLQLHLAPGSVPGALRPCQHSVVAESEHPRACVLTSLTALKSPSARPQRQSSAPSTQHPLNLAHSSPQYLGQREKWARHLGTVSSLTTNRHLCYPGGARPLPAARVQRSDAGVRAQ